MSYFLSKLLPLFIYPLGLAIILMLLAALAAWRGHRGGASGLILLGVLLLWVPATPGFSKYIQYTLEREYPPVPVKAMEKADVIIVLGGGIADVGRQKGTLDLGESFDRLYYGYQLYRAGKAPLIILSGGGASGRVAEADVMARVLGEYGVPDSAVVRERESRNTRDNGANAAALLNARGLSKAILVTSAFHMRRALGVFRRFGVDAIPAATDYHVDLRSPEMPLLEWLPSADALHGSTLAIKEYVGMEVYQQRGWMD